MIPSPRTFLALVATAGGALAGSEPPVTFNEHIAPLMHGKCANCHRPGQIAPFPLITYANVKRRAQQIVDVTSERFMPPWHADAGVIEYANDRSLKPAQIEQIARWVAAGTPEGDPAKVPAPPEFAEGWLGGEPDLIATMPEPYSVPAEGPDIYRNFVIPLNLEEDQWVSGAEFRPGDPSVVHHVLYFLDTKGKAREYDARDPAPGYSGMGRSNSQFRYLGGWDLGTQPADLPYGLALFIPKGSDFVIQVHYHPTGKAASDQSKIGFHFAKGPTARPWTIIPVPPHFGILQGIDIPAGEKEYIEKASFVVPTDCETFAVGAHAHYLGKRMEMTATFPDGSTRWLLKMSDWDFAWQEDYAFKEPIKLPAGTRLDVLLSYDNSEENPHQPTHPPKRVRWGPTSTDEMGVITLSVMFDQPEQKTAMHAALKRKLIEQFVDRLSAGDQVQLRPRARPIERRRIRIGAASVDAPRSERRPGSRCRRAPAGGRIDFEFRRDGRHWVDRLRLSCARGSRTLGRLMSLLSVGAVAAERCALPKSASLRWCWAAFVGEETRRCIAS